MVHSFCTMYSLKSIYLFIAKQTCIQKPSFNCTVWYCMFARRKYRVTGSETPSNPGGVSEEFRRRHQQREKDRREHGVYASSKEDKKRDKDRSRDKSRERRSERGDSCDHLVFHPKSSAVID